MKDLSFSIVTPFHNTKEIFFDPCFRSVLKEKDRFTDLEWIIVAHNCDAESKRMLYDKISGNSFIRVIEKEDSLRTPSSPRNTGLKEAAGDYIFFLDSDDEIADEILVNLKNSLAEKRTTGIMPDIMIYQSSVVRGSGQITPAALSLLVGNKDSVEEISDDSKERGKLLYGAGRQIWSKIYRRDFLIDNKIAFDEKIVVGEDAVFSAECYKKAAKIYIHPATGYIYHQHEQSLIQGVTAWKEEMGDGFFTDYIDGVCRVSEDKIDVSLFLLEALSFTGMLMFRKDYTRENRIRILKLMERYVEKMDLTTLPNNPDVEKTKQFVVSVYRIRGVEGK